MIQSSTFTIVTADLKRSVHFYKDILCIPLKFSDQNQIAVFETGSGTFSIYQEDDQSGSHHLAAPNNWQKGAVIVNFILEKPLDEVKGYLASKGIVIRTEVADPDLPLKMLFIEDLDGNEICLSEMRKLD